MGEFKIETIPGEGTDIRATKWLRQGEHTMVHKIENQYKEIERTIITKYRKTIWSKFVKAVQDYELIKENKNYIDNNLKKLTHDKTIGIIICKEDNKYVIKYCSDDRIIAREYELV